MDATSVTRKMPTPIAMMRSDRPNTTIAHDARKPPAKRQPASVGNIRFRFALTSSNDS
jgi:hypothetical protein